MIRWRMAFTIAPLLYPHSNVIKMDELLGLLVQILGHAFSIADMFILHDVLLL